MLEVMDEIEMATETKAALARCFEFAMENPKRFRNFLQTLTYVINWGKGDNDRGFSIPSKVVLWPDFEPHSFIFQITPYRYDDEKRAVVPGGGITIGMIYRDGFDSWGTHS